MALSIDRKLPSGITVAYARLLKADVDFANLSACLTMGHYLSGEERQAGSKPVEVREFWFEGVDPEGLPPFPFTDEGGTRAQAYNALKALPEYEGAGDV